MPRISRGLSTGQPFPYRWQREFESSLEPGLIDVLRPHRMFVVGAMSGYSALMPGPISRETSRRVFVGECALERHRLAGGTIPGTLDVLPKELLAEVPLDLDGRPIRYRREKTAWVLWSVGLDLVDEVKPAAPMYPPKAGTRVADPHLATDWRWWHVDP